MNAANSAPSVLYLNLYIFVAEKIVYFKSELKIVHTCVVPKLNRLFSELKSLFSFWLGFK